MHINFSRVYVYMYDLVQILCGRQLKPGQPDHRLIVLIYEKARYAKSSRDDDADIILALAWLVTELFSCAL